MEITANVGKVCKVAVDYTTYKPNALVVKFFTGTPKESKKTIAPYDVVAKYEVDTKNKNTLKLELTMTGDKCVSKVEMKYFNKDAAKDYAQAVILPGLSKDTVVNKEIYMNGGADKNNGKDMKAIYMVKAATCTTANGKKLTTIQLERITTSATNPITGFIDWKGDAALDITNDANPGIKKSGTVALDYVQFKASGGSSGSSSGSSGSSSTSTANKNASMTRMGLMVLLAIIFVFAH